MIICAIGLLSLSIRGQAGVGAAAFLRTYPSARGFAMGGAFSSLADDAYAAYWNPAGPATQSFMLISTTVLNTYIGDNDELSNVFPYRYFMGLTLPNLLSLSWGLYLNHFGMNDIEIRDENRIVLDTFSDTEDAILLSVSDRLFTQRAGTVYGGICLNFIQQQLGTFASANGVAMDIGFIYRMLNNSGLQFGLVWKNVAGLGKLQWDNGHNDIIYREFIIGCSYSTPFISILESIASIDFARNHNSVWQLRVGMENRLSLPGNTAFYFRAGYRDISFSTGTANITKDFLNEQSYPTFGFGFEKMLSTNSDKAISIDYATGFPKGDRYLGTQHRFSVGFQL